MARRSSRSRQRDFTTITPSLTVFRPLLSRTSPPTLPTKSKAPADDGRVYHPLGRARPAVTKSSLPASITIRDPKPKTIKRAIIIRGPGGRPMKAGTSVRIKTFSQTKARLAFANPAHVLVCLKRKIRKEVIHALRKTGKGASRKHRRRNQHSGVRC